ncbi:TetR/AcrR family transcriptional regulator [Ruminiclostridium josui]|uniref:TetR/AcrR family transcriptional regulator n=1 Tax=Ruminiclostridium josui TaxID=1499 RepID=UPI0004634A0F|nr:TetR/AcrR family transcriptional regulator [Ruminiclostridium josui]
MKENKRQLQKNSTRKRIIEAAVNEFAVNGLTTTRTADIARKAGVSHGTIFAHFHTQEELLTAVIEDVGERINTRLHEIAGGQKGFSLALKAHIEVLMEFEPFYTRLVIENRLLPKEARDTLLMLQSTVSFHLSQAIQKEVEEGSIKKLPEDMVFNGWIGLVHYYMANSDLFSPEGTVLKKCGEKMIKFYLDMVTCKNKREDD